MKMHRIFNTLIILILVCNYSIASELSKVVKRDFKVNANTFIDINNKFGKVHINTWDKNEVHVNITIVVEGDGRSSEDVLDDISIAFKDRISDNYLGITTTIGSSNNKSSYRIDYVISMPISNKLKIENSFGDTYLGDLSGDVEVSMKHGNLKAENLSGNSEITLSFGSSMSSIASVKKSYLNIKHSKITVDNAGTLQGDIQFSDLFIDKANTVDLVMKHGKLNVDEADEIIADMSFSDLLMDKLNQSAVLTLKYNKLNIGEVNNGTQKIEVNGEFSDLKIGLDNSLKMQLTLNFDFANLKYKEGDFEFRKIIKDSKSKHFEGYIGDVNAKAAMRVNSKYGDLALYVNN